MNPPRLPSPQLGTTAPDFTAKNQHGEEITLSTLRGAPVVLVFYPFAFTGICTGELTGLRDRRADFIATGARVLALSTDSIFALRVFDEQELLGLDLLSDHWPHGAIAQQYGVFDAEVGCALRGSFMLDAAGVITWKTVNRIGEARDIQEHLAALSA